MLESPAACIVARDVMNRRLLTLSPDTDALEACSLLVRHKISGAPVVGDGRIYLGVFSEKSVMRLLVDAATESIPAATVEHYMNRDRGRTIDEETPFLTLVQQFLYTPYRRLPVLKGGVLVGQVSRRDVLQKALQLTGPRAAEHHASLLYLSALREMEEAPVV